MSSDRGDELSEVAILVPWTPFGEEFSDDQDPSGNQASGEESSREESKGKERRPMIMLMCPVQPPR